MRMRRVNLSAEPRPSLDQVLGRPHTWQITGIDAFWLEDAAGTRSSGEYLATGPAYDAMLAMVERGDDPDGILLVGRRPDGGRSILGRGLDLLDVAEAHAGMPARRRRPAR